jgi:hypothetical protein
MDVGVKKTIKVGMGEKGEDWMLEGGGIFNDTMKPSHKFVAEWLVDVYASILAQTVRNVWMKKGFEWHKIIQYLISCL